jgi:hypothetical protein
MNLTIAACLARLFLELILATANIETPLDHEILIHLYCDHIPTAKVL